MFEAKIQLFYININTYTYYPKFKPENLFIKK